MRGGESAVLNNLPVPVTTFIGRKKEMEDVTRLVTNYRLVTVAGAGGSGKTRLAVEAARGLLPHFADGVWLVELAPHSDPSLIPQIVATTLGVREQGNGSTVENLIEYLRHKQTLVLLDNCEHLIQSCAAFIRELLHTCPYVCILATSREPLNIDAEVSWRLAPLSIPRPGDEISCEQLRSYEAVELFINRAWAASPDFELTPQNAARIAQICHRLDGLPLAIELAARATRILSIDELFIRLEKRFDLLTGGSRTSLQRHQTLRTLIDWSYDLLSETERQLWLRLSVFAGHFSLQAAEAICADTSHATERVLDTLTQLADKSIVTVVNEGDTKLYRLLETVRTYGWERLQETGAGEALRQRHRDWYLRLAEEAEPALDGPDQVQWLQRLTQEYENLRAALQWCRDHDDADTGLRIASNLYNFWDASGHFHEGCFWLESLLAKEPTRDIVWAKAVCALGVFKYRLGECERAIYWHQESLQVATALGDKQRMAYSLHNLGVAVAAQSDYETSHRRFEESLALHREIKNEDGIAINLFWIATVTYEQGYYGAALDQLQQSLTILRAQGNTARMAMLLRCLAAVVVQTSRRYEEARTLYKQSMELHQTLGDTSGVAYGWYGIAWVYRVAGDYARAREAAERSVALFRTTRDKRNTSCALMELAVVLQHTKESDQAASFHRKSLALRHEIKYRNGTAHSFEKIAGLLAVRKQPERAALLYGAAAALRRAIKAPLPPSEKDDYTRHLDLTRSQLNEATFAKEWAAGEALPLDEAVEHALSWLAQIESTMRSGATASRVKIAGVSLTPREIEIIRLIAAGMRRTEIAKRLHLSPATVKYYEEGLCRKLGLANRVRLSSWAVEVGLTKVGRSS